IAAKDGSLTPDVFFQGLPLSMYGAMTAPSFGIKFRGLLWYQGESNDRAPARYAALFKEFVDMYRERCGYQIPVIFTQLTNFEDPTRDVPVNAWAQIREEQKKCLKIPDTAMAVTIGIGESNDLHPRNKRDVGKRLAYCAERLIYGDTSAPEDVYPVSAEYDGDVLIRFDGKVHTDGDIKLVETVGRNGVSSAKAELTDDGLRVYCDEKPLRIRYAWSDDPASPDLFSEYDLPLSPFEIKVSDSTAKKETMLDGEIYICEYSPVHGDNGCAVILSHGYNQSTEQTGDMAEALAAAGYRAYALEFMGGGKVSHSKGRGTDMSIESEIRDLERVIAYVKGFAPKKVFLYGESQGGFVSALTAADRSDVDALALEYPAFCIPDQWAGKDPDELPDSFDFMGHTISKEYCRGVPRYDVYEKVSHFKAPVLIMQGTADKVVNAGYAHKIRQSFPNSGLILYEGEDHGFSDKGREQQKNDVIRFFDSIILPENGLTVYDDDYYRQLTVFEGCI
ncbi:MAG: alpha/beta hydrolase, partial [Oscillospiraceae bacterium]|nr:alpha/beta hydrolase [Oscillospiraceae bacterium]